MEHGVIKHVVTAKTQDTTRCRSSRIFWARIQIKAGDLENGHVQH